MTYLFYFLTFWFIISAAYFSLIITDPGRTGAYWWEYIVVAPMLALHWVAYGVKILYKKWRK